MCLCIRERAKTRCVEAKSPRPLWAALSPPLVSCATAQHSVSLVLNHVDGLNNFADTRGGQHELGALHVVAQKGAQPLVRRHVDGIGQLVEVEGSREVTHDGVALGAHGDLGME